MLAHMHLSIILAASKAICVACPQFLLRQISNNDLMILDADWMT